MNRHIATTEDCDIIEQDDKRVTLTAAAHRDCDGANG